MPKTSPSGTCILRGLPVRECNLCDLYEPKRAGKLKPRCKNCVHFLKQDAFFVEPLNDCKKDKDS